MPDSTMNFLPELKQLFDEAFRTSPTQGNGYGFALAALVAILIAISGYFVWRQRIEDKDRRNSRRELTEAIKSELADIRSEHDKAVGEFRQEFKEIRKELMSLGERVAKLKG